MNGFTKMCYRQRKKYYSVIKKKEAGHWWLTPAILDT
jgi:hypothetical protein